MLVTEASNMKKTCTETKGPILQVLHDFFNLVIQIFKDKIRFEFNIKNSLGIMQIKCFILNLDRVDIDPESKINSLLQGVLKAQSRIRTFKW